MTYPFRGAGQIGISSFARSRLGLLYLASAAGGDPTDRVSDEPASRATIAELELQTGQRRKADKKQAAYYPMRIVIEVEKLVTELDTKTYWRAYAWVKLVSIWATLRGEDTTWMEADSLE